MTTDDYKEILENNIKIVEHYGVKNQITIWIEEMSELTKELCKWSRVYDELDGDIPYDLRENIKEEVADVSVSLDQIKYAIRLMEDELMEEYKFKVDRQNRRISERRDK